MVMLKALGFMVNWGIVQHRLWNYFHPYTRETYPRECVSVILRHCYRRVACIGSVDFEEFQANSRRDVRMRSAVLRGNSIGLKFRQEIEAYKWKGHEFCFWE